MISKASAAIPGDLLKRIPIQNRQRQFRIDRKSVAAFCAALLHALGNPECAVSVAFVDKREMRRINARYRGKDYPTDVLSFLYGKLEMEGAPFLGEIVIAPSVALEHAIRYGNTPEKELRKLLVHGTLHLLGYDHETDQGQMNRIQAKLLRRKFFANPPTLAKLRGGS